MVPNDRTGSNGHKQGKHESQSEHKNILFMERVTRHWNKMPREVMESALVEILKTHPDITLGNRLETTLLQLGLLD